MSLHFPLPKNCTLVPPLPNGAGITLCVAKKFALFVKIALFILPLSNGAKSDRRIEQVMECSAVPSFFLLRKWIKFMPKTIGNRKRDCARGCARGINTTWENLQIASHKLGRRSFRSPDWFVLFDLQILSGGVYPPSATSRAISFSISNSFWYSFITVEAICSESFWALVWWLFCVTYWSKSWVDCICIVLHNVDCPSSSGT